MPQAYTYERKEGNVNIVTVVNRYDVYTTVNFVRKNVGWRRHIPWGANVFEIIQNEDLSKEEWAALIEHLEEVAEREGF